MKKNNDLTVEQVADIADCHRNTVLNYEKQGHIKSMRDNNNFRRFTLQEALKLKKIFTLRRPAEKRGN